MFIKFLFLLIAFVTCGCVQTIESKIEERIEDFTTSDISLINTELQKKSNLDLLFDGNYLFRFGDYEQSDKNFEEFNQRNLSPVSTNIKTEINNVLFTPMIEEYKPFMMDFLFVSYYQLWDALAQQRYTDARVIINQSYIKQQKMSQEYQELIKENQQSKNLSLLTDTNIETDQWYAFKDIMNSALTYLAGIYFLNTDDFENASVYLKRSAGMVPTNSFITSDLELAKAHKKPLNTTWIFLETGLAPRLKNEEIDIPMIIDNKPTIISIASSKPIFDKTNINNIQDFQKLADIDTMFMTEYKEYKKNNILRSVTSSASKAMLQSVAYNSKTKYSGILGFLTTIYSISTTKSEIRTWATLPQNIYLFRMTNNKTGLIKMKLTDNIVLNLNIPIKTNNLVYVRMLKSKMYTKVIPIK